MLESEVWELLLGRILRQISCWQYLETMKTSHLEKQPFFSSDSSPFNIITACQPILIVNVFY